MRLFIGIEIDEAVRARAVAIAESLRGRLESAGRQGGRMRWIPAGNLHITLWFLGEVQDDRTDAITRALGVPFGLAPFDLHLSGLGIFPPSGAPRVVWLGTRGEEALARLHAELAARLRPLGFEPERRQYSAHLTLARIATPPIGTRRADVRDAIGGLPGDAGSCRVDAVTLFHSRLSPKGATYDALLRVPLV